MTSASASAPLRFSLGGGGSDLPAYASRFGGYIVAATIDKYVRVSVRSQPGAAIAFTWTDAGVTRRIDPATQPILREALRLCGVDGGIEITSEADLPSGMGLGSSGAFTVALLAALRAHAGESASPRRLAEEACHVELELVGEPAGKQDPYIAAYGGVRALVFDRDGGVTVEPVSVTHETLGALAERLLVVDTGVARPARTVLGEQGSRLRSLDADAIDGMHRVKAMGHAMRRLLVDGDVDRFGELLHEHWTRKRAFASRMSDASLDGHYEAAREAGAIGGKLMGAGGGGYFLLHARPSDRPSVATAMRARGLRTVDFAFASDGVRVVQGDSPR